MIPRDPAFDNTLAFFREGYAFVGNHCRQLESDAFETRLMLRRVICMMGEEAARHFYDGASFTRVGAMPQTTLRLLQDKGSVQMLNGARHARRKSMFLNLTTEPHAVALARTFEGHLDHALAAGRSSGRIVLHDTLLPLLTGAGCDWAGIDLSARDGPWLTAAFSAMIDGAGSAGPRAWRALLLRRRAEGWARSQIKSARAFGRADDTPLAAIARFQDQSDALLNERSAGVELLNIIRPIVAVSRFITFAVLALHEHPDAATWLRSGGDERLWAFAQEVRRFYPFFPVIGGRVRSGFEWQGHGFHDGDWVLLGLHATNHDQRLWPEPKAFRPDRFIGWRSSGFDLIPQGAGDHRVDHRCPGESLTIELIKSALRFFGERLRYDVPAQDLSIPLNRFPTLPKDGLVLSIR